MKKIINVIIVALMMFAALQADDYDQLQKLVASDRAVDDQFGFTVSISGDYAIVGVYREDEDSSGNNTLSFAGSAYIFKYDGTSWSQQAKLVASDRAADDNFGVSVSISGDYAVVGAYHEDHDDSGNDSLSNAGSAYIFKRNGTSWSQQAKLVASDRGVDDSFGRDVSINGDYAIVGAYTEDENASGNNSLSNAGSAYIFKRDDTSWGQQAKLVASNRGADDRFGYSVSINGDYALVGASREDEDASENDSLLNSGSAYIFKCDGTNWGQQAKLVATDREASDYFGYSVSISGDYAIVGALGEDEDASGNDSLINAGSAYIFKRDGTSWGQQAKLVTSDRATNDYFGNSVSINGYYAIVGAYYEDHDASGKNLMTQAGSAYIFGCDGTSWSQQAKLVASDRRASDYFSYSVAISSDFAFVGAYLEDQDVSGDNTMANSGSAYIFEMPPTDVPTPVTLSSFSAKTKKGQINLSWRTENETNNSHFIIYRNGEAVGRVEGAGTSSEPHDYTFDDVNIVSGLTYTYMLADVDYGNNETLYENEAVTITLNENVIVEEFAVSEAYPNPFNPSTCIDYQLPTESLVNFNIYDLNGQKIRTLVSGLQDAGYYSINFHAGDLPSGVYLYRFTAGNEVVTKKMVLMK